MSKTPDYVIDGDVTVRNGIADAKTLPAGSFVRPLQLCYVPKHITENPNHAYFNTEKQVFCYTSIGIIPIDRDCIREA